jgi:hypothetical protein
MGAGSKNTFIASSNQVASGILGVTVLASGASASTGGAATSYDIGNFTVTGGLGTNDILVIEIAAINVGGATNLLTYLDTAAGALGGGKVPLSGTAAEDVQGTTKIQKSIDGTATRVFISRVVNGGTFAGGVTNNSAVVNADTTFTGYLKIDSSAAFTFAYKWLVYIIKGV